MKAGYPLHYLALTINGRYAKVFAAVCFKDLQDRLLEWRDIKGFIFGKPGAGIIRYDIHVIVLGNGWPAWRFDPLLLVILTDLRLGITTKF